MKNILDIESILLLWEKRKLDREKIEKQYKRYTGKIVIASDLHIPFVRSEALKRLKQETPKALVVIAGDIFCFDLFSRYLVYPHQFRDFPTEIQFGKMLIEQIAQKSLFTVGLMANHEVRLRKFLIRTLGTGTTEQLEKTGMANLQKVLQIDKFHFLDDWLVQIGNVLICHPEESSVVKGKVGEWAVNYFTLRKDFDIVVCGHTHWQSIIPVRGKWAVECGAMCKALDYTRLGKLGRGKYDVWYIGFVVIEMKNGKASINDVKLINLGTEEGY